MDVIIWGAGKWGELAYWYYEKHANILFFIDSDKNKIGSVMPGTNIYIREVNCINSIRVDKIVVAVNKHKEILTILRSMRICPEKIECFTPDMLDEPSSSAYLPQMVEIDCAKFNLCSYLEGNFSWRNKEAKECGDYFPSLVIMVGRGDKVQNLCFLKKIIKDVSSLQVRIVALRLMFENECFDNECMKLFMDSLQDVDNEDDTVYGLVMDASFMVHIHFNYLYDDFYVQRRRLLEELCKKYKMKVPYNCNESNENKIAILAYCDLYFDKYSGAPEKILTSYANCFQKLGVKVEIFILCSTYRTNDDNVYLRELVCFDHYDDTNAKEIKKRLNSGIVIHRFYNKDIKRRLQDSVDEIVSFNPSYILDMSDEIALQPYVLQRLYPVIYRPLRRQMSSSFFDAYITGNKKMCIAENEIYKSVPIEKMYEIDMLNLPDEINNICVHDRRNIGFCETDFILVTVGSRLQYEITDELIYAVVGLMKENKNIKWLLVGEKVKSEIKSFKEMIDDHRIILWGYEDNLCSLYKICDAYLQPDRPGGGLSIRQAMREGLPVIMSDYPSDQKARMDEADLIIGGLENMMRHIKKLSSDKEFYELTSIRMKNAIKKSSPMKDARKLLAVCKEVRRKKLEGKNS